MAKLAPRPVLSTLDKNGAEIPDPIPMAPPVGFRAEITQDQRIRQMVLAEHNRLRAELYEESEDEANDFDIDDDPIDPNTPYEVGFDPVDAEARRLLRDDRWRRMVDMRLKALNPQEEPNGVRSGTDERREDDTGRRSDNEREVTGQRSGEDEKPPVPGSVRSRAQGTEGSSGKGSRG